MARNSQPGPRTAAIGGLVGLLAAVLGYLLTFVLIRRAVSEAVGDSVPTWKGVLWYHFNAHFVRVHETAAYGPWEGSETANLISQTQGTEIAYVVPPLVLLFGGILAPRSLSWRSAADAAVRGATVVLGYALAVLMGVVVATRDVDGEFLGAQFSSTVSVEPVQALVVAGLLYPLVCGSAGGAIWAILEGR